MDNKPIGERVVFDEIKQFSSTILSKVLLVVNLLFSFVFITLAQIVLMILAFLFAFTTAFGAANIQMLKEFFLPFFATLFGFVFVASAFGKMLNPQNFEQFKKGLFLAYFSMIFLIATYFFAFLAINVFPNQMEFLRIGWGLFLLATTYFFFEGMKKILFVLREELLN